MYVILNPHSNTNHSDKYRVVDDVQWQRFANGDTNVLKFAAETSDYLEAETLRDELNNGPHNITNESYIRSVTHWIWVSPNDVRHLVGIDGKCETCGRSHTKEET